MSCRVFYWHQSAYADSAFFTDSRLPWQSIASTCHCSHVTLFPIAFTRPWIISRLFLITKSCWHCLQTFYKNIMTRMRRLRLLHRLIQLIIILPRMSKVQANCTLLTVTCVSNQNRGKRCFLNWTIQKIKFDKVLHILQKENLHPALHKHSATRNNHNDRRKFCILMTWDTILVERLWMNKSYKRAVYIVIRATMSGLGNKQM